MLCLYWQYISKLGVPPIDIPIGCSLESTKNSSTFKNFSRPFALIPDGKFYHIVLKFNTLKLEGPIFTGLLLSS